MNIKNKVKIMENLTEEMLDVLHLQLGDNIIGEETILGDELQETPLDLQQIRIDYQQSTLFWNQDGPEMEQCVDVAVPFRDAAINCRLYYPKQRDNAGCLFFLHGGGFIVGNLETHDRMMRLFAQESGCLVIGVDYMLSPEAKFPQAIMETVAAVDYFRAQAKHYGFSPESIGLAGESAGAHLALASYLWLRDHNVETDYVKAMLLYYGFYGLRDSRTRRLYGGAWDRLGEEDLAFYEEMYLASPQDRLSPYYCLFNNSLTERMPAFYIGACEFDPLCDDSETLAVMLEDKGIPCEYQMYPGVLHGFLHNSKIMDAPLEAISEGCHFFNANC